TVPGCRVPHFELNDGRSLYDAFGPGYTLLVIDASVDVSALEVAAQSVRMPLTVLNLSEEATLPSLYKHGLIVCRSDQHVAWRGNALPNDCDALVRLLTGLSQDAMRAS